MGGILPAGKLTQEIATIRHVPMGQDVLSPPAHSAFSTPGGLLEFVQHLRELSGGKPVGFKLCIGKRREFLAICKAMIKTGILPDFITVDGSEGGTGAAPLEFSNRIGTPGTEALIFVHNALKGFGVRDKVRVIATGKVTTGFHIIRSLALGADLVNSARAMMMAIGCIQALKCNSNECPTGITTQHPGLMAGLVVKDKRPRVAEYHRSTIESTLEMLGAMGLRNPAELRPWHIMRRTSPTDIHHYGELCDYLEDGALIREPLPAGYERACLTASPDTFAHTEERTAGAASD